MSEGILCGLREALVSSELDHVNHVIHNRSDYFFNCFISKAWDPVVSAEALTRIDNHDGSATGKDLRAEAEFFFDNQSIEKIGKNRLSERQTAIYNINQTKIDLILLDNFMDIASMLARDKETEQRFFLLSAAFRPDTFSRHYEWVDFLESHESLDNWIEIICWLQKKQPDAAIFFTPFPRVVYGHENRLSVQRALRFREIISERHIPATVLDAPNVDEDSLTSTDDWCHYSHSYYKGLAEIVAKSLDRSQYGSIHNVFAYQR